MKANGRIVPVGDLRTLGKALSSWEAFRGHFITATGVEIDLIHALFDRWESVAGRVHNPLCQQLVKGAPGCELCAETFALQIQRADEAEVGEFTTCCCYAGQRFSVTRLTESPNANIYLLVGRVPMPQVNSAISEEKYQGALQLASIILSQLQLDWEDDQLQNSLEMPLSIRKACHYIHDHFHENCHVEDVADHCGLSRDWLSRHFKKATGHSLPEYIRQHRLDSAAELLTETDRSITEICFESGFQSISQFNRLFHKKFSMSPSAFRKQAPEKSGRD
ncbi:MAG: helix-turn-helix transcriptional regulator [Akkermansiaceae bacterium]|nr:helix-turn-helix transcriptional regulator [Akkermansiaceae bacterium]